MWLRGTVLEVVSVRPEGSQRASTYIKAKYKVGNVEKIKLILISQLRKEDPAAVTGDIAAVPPSIPPDTLPDAANAATTNNNTANPSPPTNAVPPPEGTNTSNQSSVRVPVATAHNQEWFDGEVELPTNGPFTQTRLGS